MIRYLLYFLMCILTGCNVLPYKFKSPDNPLNTLEVPSKNIIMVNARGRAVDPTGNINCTGGTGGSLCEGKHIDSSDYSELELVADENKLPIYTKYVDDLLDALNEYKGPRKILIYIHGGLNTQADAVERATILNKPITDAGYYPIFINWQSSLITSYKDHLLYLRQGSDWREGRLPGKIAGWATSPFYFLGDVTRAIVRAPVAMSIQVANDLTTVKNFRRGWSHSSPDLPHAERVAFEILCEQDPTKPDHYRKLTGYSEKKSCDNKKVSEDHFPISIGDDNRSNNQRDLAFTVYPITFPTKILAAPIIDTFGTSAWNSMLRTQSMLFHYDNDLEEHHPKGDPIPTYKRTGVLSFFLQKLEQNIICKKELCERNDEWEITLVAHSAGAIIMNEIIRSYGHLPIQNIVYMGGAATIRDYENVIFPYLTQKNLPENKAKVTTPVRVYHLMLHEAAESGETSYGDFPPRGSLLIWIDNFLSNPLSKSDRTMGRFVNLMGALHHTPTKLKRYINIHKFAAGKLTKSPQSHGSLNHLKFWSKDCWMPKADHKPGDCFPPEKDKGSFRN